MVQDLEAKSVSKYLVESLFGKVFTYRVFVAKVVNIVENQLQQNFELKIRLGRFKNGILILQYISVI